MEKLEIDLAGFHVEQLKEFDVHERHAVVDAVICYLKITRSEVIGLLNKEAQNKEAQINELLEMLRGLKFYRNFIGEIVIRHNEESETFYFSPYATEGGSSSPGKRRGARARKYRGMSNPRRTNRAPVDPLA